MSKKHLPGLMSSKRRKLIKHYADAINRQMGLSLSKVKPRKWMSDFIGMIVERAHQLFVERSMVLRDGEVITIIVDSDGCSDLDDAPKLLIENIDGLPRLTTTGVELELQNDLPQPVLPQPVPLMPVDLLVLLELYGYGCVNEEMRSRPVYQESLDRLEGRKFVSVKHFDSGNIVVITKAGEDYVRYICGEAIPVTINLDEVTSVNQLLIDA